MAIKNNKRYIELDDMLDKIEKNDSDMNWAEKVKKLKKKYENIINSLGDRVFF